MKAKIFIAALFSLFGFLLAAPLPESVSESSKGILDGVAGGTTTTTKSPGGLNALPGLNAVSNSGPMLILGGFQAVVTKFDPSLVQGLPGLAGVPSLMG
jgi:hypothetical protein